jgi:DNA-binding response OmpR family regulator
MLKGFTAEITVESDQQVDVPSADHPGQGNFYGIDWWSPKGIDNGAIMGSSQAQKLLIVDDNPRLLELLQMRFSQAGYQTTVLERVKDALIAAITEKPDLIIADIMIPEIGGWEFKKLLNNIPGMADIPFIFLTTDESLPLESYTEGFGPIDHLRKPYSFEELLAKVETNLRRKTKRDEARSVESETSGGTLEDMTLVDVMQVLAMNRKTCSVTLVKGKEIGKIYFREGRLLDAKVADLQGDEAVYELLGWKGSDFSIGDELKPPIQESVTRDLHALIAEGLQRIEEAERVGSSSLLAAQLHETEQPSRAPSESGFPPAEQTGLPNGPSGSPATPPTRPAQEATASQLPEGSPHPPDRRRHLPSGPSPEDPKTFLERMKKLGLVEELTS